MFIKAHSLVLHRFLSGVTKVIFNVVLPLSIYGITGQLWQVFLFLFIKHASNALMTFLFSGYLTSAPVFAITLHIVALIFAQLVIGFNAVSVPMLVLLALSMSAAETFYSIPLNVIFAIKSPSSRVERMQIPYIMGGILFMVLYQIAKSFYTEGEIFTFGTVCYAFSLIPLIADRKEIQYGSYCDKPFSIKQKIFHNHRTNIFHFSLGMFTGTMSEILPLYVLLYARDVSVLFYILIAIESCKILTNLVGANLFKKGYYNLAIGGSALVFAISFSLMTVIENPYYIYFLSIAVGLFFPINFVNKFGSFLTKSKRASLVNINIVFRDQYMQFGRMAISLVFLLTRSLNGVMLSAAVACLIMLSTSYDFTTSLIPHAVKKAFKKAMASLEQLPL